MPNRHKNAELKRQKARDARDSSKRQLTEADLITPNNDCADVWHAASRAGVLVSTPTETADAWPTGPFESIMVPIGVGSEEPAPPPAASWCSIS